jgi:hypothetical protein
MNYKDIINRLYIIQDGIEGDSFTADNISDLIRHIKRSIEE